MTPVNWERLPGDTVQEFIAALVLLRWPSGNLITPSRGDRGVDIRVRVGDAFDIYQVKRYARPPTAKQWRDIESSWQTFLTETASVLPINKWHLVMPWDPSNEALERLDAMTAGSGLDTEWVGRVTVDVWASQNPRLVSYYFGDGADRLQELISQAVLAGSPIPEGESGDVLLASVSARAAALQSALDEVDPFYRYEIDVRTGSLQDDSEWQSQIGNRPGYVMMSAEQISPTQYVVRRIYPRSAESTTLRPIRKDVTLLAERGSPEQSAIEAFRDFGAPFRDVKGTVDHVEGPPGTGEPGEAYFSLMLASAAADSLPPLELRVIATSDGSVVHSVPVDNVERSTAPDGQGHYLAFQEDSGLLRFQIHTGRKGKPSTVNITREAFAGREPGAVVRALELFAALVDGTHLELGIRNGRAVFPAFQLDAEQLRAGAEQYLPFVRALETIQSHTFTRIVIPEIGQLVIEQERDILNNARLLRGEQMTATWAGLTTTLTHPDSLAQYEERNFLMVHERPLTVMVGDVEIETDKVRRVFYKTARVADGVDLGSLQVGDELRIEPGDTNEVLVWAIPRSASRLYNEE